MIFHSVVNVIELVQQLQECDWSFESLAVFHFFAVKFPFGEGGEFVEDEELVDRSARLAMHQR